MGDMHASLKLPLRLVANRVYRFYRGGAQLDAFRDVARPEDTDFPEDWVGSVTPATNPPEHARPREGLSTVDVDGATTTLAELLARDPVAVAGHDVVERYGPTTGLLVKLLDAASRLPIHGHPTRTFARRVLASPFGKAEAWIVLATRQMPEAPPPRVWLGFREPVGREQLQRWIERQETDTMLDAMNEIPVKPGDAVFVRPGLPHAIGAGVFLMEAQEPTDFSVVAEYRGYPIDPVDAHLRRGWDVMLDCFDRAAVTPTELTELLPEPMPLSIDAGGAWLGEDLLGAQSDGYFHVQRLTLRGRWPWPHPGTFAVIVVTAGRGVAETAHGRLELTRGDTLAILAGTAPTTMSGELEMLVAMPPLG